MGIAACRGPAGDTGPRGPAGESSACSVTSNTDGTKTVRCDDGTEVTLTNGETGATGTSCSIVDNGDGTKTITCGTTSVTLNDGATGPQGIPGAQTFLVGADSVSSLTLAVNSIVIASPPVVNFTLTDSAGRGAVGVKAGSSGQLRFTLAKLVPGASANESPQWKSYVNGAVTGGPGYQPTFERTGILTDNGDGSYSYRFATDVTAVTAPVAVSYDASFTHRLAIQLSGTVNGIALPAVNYTQDFVPAGGAVTTKRDMTIIASCNECHGKLAAHGSRYEFKLCVTCHQPGLVDNNAPNADFDMPYMIHAIHGAAKRDSEGLPDYTLTDRNGDVVSFAGVGLPQQVNNCRKCHNVADAATPQGDWWQRYPRKEACGACHNIDTIVSPSHDSFANSGCTGCHSASAIETVHLTENATLNNPILPPGAAVFTYEIGKVTVNASDQAVVTFRILKDGQPVVFNDYSGATNIDKRTFVASGLLTGFTGSPSFLVAYATAQGGIDEPADYNNTGKTAAQPASVSIAELKTGDGGSIAPATDPSAPAGSYDATLVQAVTRSSSGCSATPPVAPCGNITTTVDATFPSGATLRTVGLNGYFTQVSPALARHTQSVTKAVEGDQARRDVVSSAKCSNCHEWFEGHGGNRVITQNDGVQICVMCHVPNLSTSGRTADPATVLARMSAADQQAMTDAGYDPADPLTFPEDTNNLKDMIHGIHAAHARSTPYRFVRDRGSSGVFYYDWSHVTYPNILASCETCHLPDTYLGAPATALPTTLMIPGADRAEILARRASVPNDTDVVNTPVSSACYYCHDSALAGAHMEQNGGFINIPRSETVDTQGNPTYFETCALCHGEGRQADIKIVHELE